MPHPPSSRGIAADYLTPRKSVGHDEAVPSTRDDRVLPYTRTLSAVIVPFLVGAWVILYLFPDDTKRLFAWTIRPTMTPMVLASAYLGGAYFFVRVVRERHWHAVKTGFLAVTLFAALLGVATILHWDKFNHRHVTFWIWVVLYFTTPFLVLGGWLANRRHAPLPSPEEPRLGRTARFVIALVGMVALLQGALMFVDPPLELRYWPWLLTPLTCRVLGAVFCLGVAGIAVLADPRWTSVKLMVQVAMLMIALILIAAARAVAEFDTHQPLTWMLLSGFVAILVGAAYLSYTMGFRSGLGDRRSQGSRAASNR
jgi:hypothetical protein